jgi:hypothetical protein
MLRSYYQRRISIRIKHATIIVMLLHSTLLITVSFLPSSGSRLSKISRFSCFLAYRGVHDVSMDSRCESANHICYSSVAALHASICFEKLQYCHFTQLCIKSWQPFVGNGHDGERFIFKIKIWRNPLPKNIPTIGRIPSQFNLTSTLPIPIPPQPALTRP